MAPTRLLLEGPAIEPLLRRARAEHGPNVRIVKAERVRVGGFVGFFAREQFEVTLEVDDDGGAPAAPAAAPWVRHDVPGQLGQPSQRLVVPSAALSAAGPMGIDALLAAAEDAERVPGAAGQSGDFDSIFTSMLTTGAPSLPPRPAQFAQPARGGAQVLPAAEVVHPARVVTSATSLAAPTATAGHAAVALAEAPAPPQVTPVNQPFRRQAVQPATATLAGDGHQISLPEALLVQRAAPGIVQPGIEPGGVQPGGAATGPMMRSQPANAPAARAPHLGGPGFSAPLLPGPPPSALPFSGSPEALGAGSTHSGSHPQVHGRHAHHHFDVPLSEQLASLGVPSEWLWDLPAGRSAALRSVASRIAAAQARLPRRPVTSPAPVLAVMAELSAAVPVARHLAAGLGLDPSEVAVLQRRGHGAPHQRLLAGGREILSEARGRRLEGRPLVVALPAPIGADPASRAVVGDVLGELAPDDVWAVVDATRRLPDTSAWLASLAGHRGVDALALVHLGATSAPAAALALPVPVVLLGERPASPRAWVEMLAARLSDRVAP